MDHQKTYTGQVSNSKPEPMSTTSRNSTVRQPPYQPNYQNNNFRSNGPRNFVSQELFQIENQCDGLQNIAIDSNNEAAGQNLTETSFNPQEQKLYEHQDIQDNGNYNAEYYENAYYDGFGDPTEEYFETPENFPNTGQDNNRI